MTAGLRPRSAWVFDPAAVTTAGLHEALPFAAITFYVILSVAKDL